MLTTSPNPLARLVRRLNAPLALDAALSIVCEETARVLDAPACAIQLRDEKRGVFSIAASFGLPEEYAAQAEPIADAEYAELVARLGPTFVSSNLPPFAAPLDLAATATATIFREGKMVGALTLFSFHIARDYTADEIILLEAIAHLAAQAITAARELEEKRATAERLTLLQELETVRDLSNTLRTAQSLDEMLALLLERTLAVLDASAGSVRLHDPASDELRLAVARGWLHHSARPLKKGAGIEGYVFLTRAPYRTREFLTDVQMSQAEREHIPAGWGGAVVPISSDDEMVGVLSVSVPLPREITEQETHLLMLLAEIAGNAIRRARQHEQTTQRLRRLASLRAIDTAITSSMDLRLTMQIFLAQVTGELSVDAADVLLLNPEQQVLEYTAGRGFHSNAIALTRMPWGEGLAAEAARERRTISIPTGANSLQSARLAGENFNAYFAAPIIVKGQVKGVLEIFHRAPLSPNGEWMDFLQALAGQAAIAIDNYSLFNQLQRSNVELALAYDTMLEGWSRALDLRDRETHGHSERVTEITLDLARMVGIDDRECVHVRRGALLHDIGKMAIPDSILLKPGPLTDAEWAIMRKHPVYAYELLAPIGVLRPALDIPYCHHEKWDGSGYPRRLQGGAIPLAARVFAVVDVWDALRSDRPYRQAWSDADTREYLREQASAHFDPQIVEKFLRLDF